MTQFDVLHKKKGSSEKATLFAAELPLMIRDGSAFFLAQGHRVTEEFDRSLSVWRKKADRERRIQCRKGCSHCCDTLNWTSLAEALLLYPRLDPGEIRRFAEMDRLTHHLRQTVLDDSFYERYRREIGRCPLLDRYSACRLHPWRPLSCRSVFSFFPPFLCRSDIPERVGYDRLTDCIRRRPSSLYHDTPYALEPIIRRHRAGRRMRALSLKTRDFYLEGALPSLITLLHGVYTRREEDPHRRPPLSTWLGDRLESGLLTAAIRSST